MTVTSTETQSPIKNLRPSSSYELVIIAENGVGESLPSVKVPFQTEGEGGFPDRYTTFKVYNTRFEPLTSPDKPNVITQCTTRTQVSLTFI